MNARQKEVEGRQPLVMLLAIIDIIAVAFAIASAANL